MVLNVKNTTAADIFHASTGINFPFGVYSVVSSHDQSNFTDAQSFSLIGNGGFVINNGASDITDSSQAWAFITGDQVKAVSVQSIPAIASKNLGAKALFKRVVGLFQSLAAGDNNIIWACSFPWVKFMAVEIINAEIGDYVSLYVLDSATGAYSGHANYPLNQFGFNASVAKDFYVHKSEFDADLYSGLQIKLVYHSVTAKTIGVNLVMNEVK